VPYGDALAPLLRLEDRLLLQAGDAQLRPLRLTLLETVRQYAAARLAERGETAQIRDKHLDWCLALAERAEPELKGPKQIAWLERLDVEHDNLRAALVWAREREAVEGGLRLAGALWRFWHKRSYFAEGLTWLEGLLIGSEGACLEVRAKALNGAGALAKAQGDYTRAWALHEEALAARRKLGDQVAIAASLGNLGAVARSQGDRTRAAAFHEQALAAARQSEDKWTIATCLLNLGHLAYECADYTKAAALCGEALTLKRELGDTLGTALALYNLAHTPFRRGEYERAACLYAECLALMRGLGDKLRIAGAALSLGTALCRLGEHSRAVVVLREGIKLSRDIGARDALSEGLDNMAELVSAQGRSGQAARLAGAAEALRELVRKPIPPADRAEYETLMLNLRAALGDEVFAAVWAEGRALSLDEAVALAMA